jgi:predicted RNA-binding protein with PUA-like domain
MKSEPDVFGIADLARVKIEPWTGVRSYFARAHMRAMSVGDSVLFHHSNAKPPGVVGTARVVRTQVIDETQFDPAGKYFEPKATREVPIWDCVEVEYVATLPHLVSMDRIRSEPALADMMLLRQGRLSVQPVTEAEYETIVALGQVPPPEPVKRAKPAKSAKSAKAAKATVAAKAASKPGRAAKPARGKPARAKSPARAKRSRNAR